MLVVTQGDANGVGPEILLKAHDAGRLPGAYVVVGDAAALCACKRAIGSRAEIHTIGDLAEHIPGKLNLLDTGLLTEADITPGKPDRAVAAAARACIVRAAELCRDGACAAMVTLPVNKEAIRKSDSAFTGHTELIAEIAGQTEYTMMLSSPKLTVTHVSTHVSLAEAIARVTEKRVRTTISLTHDALRRFLKNPRIAVAGLNPHAGEGGAFGREEVEAIAPAIAAARESGIDATGPLPPDTVFLAAARGQYDAVVCMYHDQGHIPMKLLAFETGVNVTLGLSILRTSVDHGTAYDIAWQNTASAQSFIEAFQYAGRLVGEGGG